MRTMSISITGEQAQIIDRAVLQYGFANRSEFFRALLRFFLYRPTAILEADSLVFENPDTRDASEVLASFKAAGLYSKEFLKDLETGLKDSTYFK